MSGWEDKYLDPADEALFEEFADFAFGPKPESGPAGTPSLGPTSRSASSRSASLSDESTSRSSTSRSSTSGKGEPSLHGKGLADWDRDEAFARAVLRLFGVRADLNQPFLSVIPGFEGESAIVELDYGVWRYRHPGRCGKSAFYTLAEAFASVTAGREIRLGHQPKHALWKRRLLVETGCISMVPILLPTLPPALTWVPKVLSGFVMLLQVRRLTEPTTEEVPFSIRFAADWTGTSFDAAADAIRWLAKNDFLIKKEELEAKNDHDHGAYVYRLGDGR